MAVVALAGIVALAGPASAVTFDVRVQVGWLNDTGTCNDSGTNDCLGFNGAGGFGAGSSLQMNWDNTTDSIDSLLIVGALPETSAFPTGDATTTIDPGQTIQTAQIRHVNNAIPQEQLYAVTVNFTWKDLRTGRVLVDRRNFRQTTTYYPTLGEGRFVGSQQAVERLALGIVQEMQADW